MAANDIDAALIHEAAIGKIAGEQLIKLMTLGLSEKEAEEQIVNGFLKQDMYGKMKGAGKNKQEKRNTERGGRME